MKTVMKENSLAKFKQIKCQIQVFHLGSLMKDYAVFTGHWRPVEVIHSRNLEGMALTGWEWEEKTIGWVVRAGEWENLLQE